MAVQTGAGTELYISASIPATFDSTGYTAVTGWKKVGEITSPGTHGRTYNEVLHNPVDTRGTQIFKGGFRETPKTLNLAVDEADEGQILMKTALNSDANHSFKVVYGDGAIDYFQAKVMGFEKSVESVDSIVSATSTLAITTSKTGIGIVEVAAP